MRNKVFVVLKTCDWFDCLDSVWSTKRDAEKRAKRVNEIDEYSRAFVYSKTVRKGK